MERRFSSVFDALAERVRGEGFRAILRQSDNDELVAALAAAGATDPVAANAIATELLNRLRRAPFLGAFFVSFTTLIMIYALDYLYTGTFLLLDSGPRGYILAGVSVGIAGLSALFLLMWRGAFRGLRMALRRDHRSY